MFSRISLAATMVAALCVPALADTYKFDSSHSAAQFSIQHLMISNVKGQFSKVTGTVDYDPKNPKAASVEASIDVGTVDTREAKRDEHLKSADFFDVEKYPTITFKSKKVLSASKGKLKVLGDLTMHGVTQEVPLNVTVSNPIKDPRGMERMGAEATTTLVRKNFNLTWNKNIDGGGVVLGDEVPVTIDAELIKEPKVAEAK